MWPATEYDATRPPRILPCIPVLPFHWLSAVGPLWFNSVGPAKLFTRWVEALPHGSLVPPVLTDLPTSLYGRCLIMVIFSFIYIYIS